MLYFEDFKVGEKSITHSRTITEADIVNFAALSGDWNPLHVDKEFAHNGPFGERIAHGLLVLSGVFIVLCQGISIYNYYHNFNAFSSLPSKNIDS
jgi:acyl dehydratase